jgi:hypothetical protein
MKQFIAAGRINALQSVTVMPTSIKFDPQLAGARGKKWDIFQAE